MLGNAQVNFTGDGSTCAMGTFNDTVATLNGLNSILGRTITLQTTTNIVVAQGIIGRNNVNQAAEDATQLTGRQTGVTKAGCYFSFTNVKASEPVPGPAGGYMTFDLSDPTNPDSDVV